MSKDRLCARCGAPLDFSEFNIPAALAFCSQCVNREDFTIATQGHRVVVVPRKKEDESDEDDGNQNQ